MRELWSKSLFRTGAAMDPSVVDVPVRFDYTGAVQEYTVPKGCKKLRVDCVGAAGGAGEGASAPKGGRVECVLSVKSGEILYIYVGQQGAAASATNYEAFGGGGLKNTVPSNRGYCGAGGGSSDIRKIKASDGSYYDTSHTSWETDASLLSRIVVAGAGGGAAWGIAGGAGGGLTGGDANSNISGWDDVKGRGGTQTSGGARTIGASMAGSFCKGGDIDASYSLGDRAYGAAGGGGWYGGSSGGPNGGGGGGSSYTDEDVCSDVVHTQGYASATGNGWIILTPIK